MATVTEYGGRLRVKSAVAFTWNRWPPWCGISGRLAVESVAALAWNTHPNGGQSEKVALFGRD